MKLFRGRWDPEINHKRLFYRDIAPVAPAVFVALFVCLEFDLLDSVILKTNQDYIHSQ
jgi:hypothetical protein